MTGSTKLEKELLKNPSSRFSVLTTAVLVLLIKDLQKLSDKETDFTLQFNNTKNIKPFKFISWPNFIEVYQKKYSALVFEGKPLLIDLPSIKLCNLQNEQFTNYFMSRTVKNNMSLMPILYSIESCLKLPYISKLVNLNCTCKISLKATIMRTSSQFHNGVHFKILPTFI